MRTIGLIGGLSWESTVIYYQAVNQRVRERLGGSHSADTLVWSGDFQPVEDMLFTGKWDELGELLAGAGQKLEGMGAELLLICSNSCSRVNDALERVANVPVLHIADAVGTEISARGMRKVGLLGTLYTMDLEESFYPEMLAKYGVDVIVPELEDREEVHQVIFEELVRGVLSPSSRDAFVRTIDKLAAAGAEAVILGCTEIELLITDKDTAIPLLPSARLHAEAAAAFALAD
ncbi:aspartate/glutamate racemase family protein [Amycolatopsis jejuensis]|uniref:aspartate/glutamate racemase family protein n=1 Tax=Amycolatopsis jejuensis TaxID=330084 RepID=UPI000526C78E|nr:amino acid racemase [Amycolatopsis jejuensis]